MDTAGSRPASRFIASQVGFTPVTAEHFPVLWEWRHRPHIEPWWEPWSPKTYEAAAAEWTKQVAGTSPGRPYLIAVDGRPVGYIEGYKLSDDPEHWKALDLGHDVVRADVYIAETNYLYPGLAQLA